MSDRKVIPIGGGKAAVYSKTVAQPATLATRMDEINNSPTFVTFRLRGEGGAALQVMIPWCRFRDAEELPDHYIARSCDCGGDVCGHPTQFLYVAKKSMRDWYLVQEIGPTLVFEYRRRF